MSGMGRLTELLPCPFCGDNHATTTYTRDGRLVVCTSCGAKSGNYYHGPKDLPSADERAIAAWNRRASHASPAPSALVKALRTAEAALSDIGDAEREEGDDLAWCEGRAAKALPLIRPVLRAALITTPAPSDGLREENERLWAVLEEAVGILCAQCPGHGDVDRLAALVEFGPNRAALMTPAPAQEGEPRHD